MACILFWWDSSISSLFVLRRVLQLVSLASLAMLALFYPLIESLDGFDSPIPASDLEIQIIVLLTFVGLVFVLAHLLVSVAISAVMDVFRYLGVQSRVLIGMKPVLFYPLLSPSPPLPLRI